MTAKSDKSSELLAHTITVSIATRNELSQDRRSKHTAIITILYAVGMINLGLVSALRFLSPDMIVMIPYVGMGIVLLSMFMVRVHREALHKLEHAGADVEDFFDDKTVLGPRALFERPKTTKASYRTIPVAVHVTLAVFWAGFWLFS